MRASSAPAPGMSQTLAMSTTSTSSLPGGVIQKTGVETLDVDSIENPKRAEEAVDGLHETAKRYEQEVNDHLETLRAAKRVGAYELDVPSSIGEVPLPSLGGREWVASHEEAVPFEVLTHLVLVTEYKRKVKVARLKQRTLSLRFTDQTSIDDHT